MSARIHFNMKFTHNHVNGTVKITATRAACYLVVILCIIAILESVLSLDQSLCDGGGQQVLAPCVLVASERNDHGSQRNEQI